MGKATNSLKHNELSHLQAGDLENTLTGLPALAILGLFGSWFVSDSLFVNVGTPMNNGPTGAESYLFP